MDLDETRWKLFPGVSRSFLNSSGTKITAKHRKETEIQNFRKFQNFKIKKMIFVFLRFLAVILVPELFRKLRETHTKHSHQFRSKSDGFRMSYEEKTYFKMTQNRVENSLYSVLC